VTDEQFERDLAVVNTRLNQLIAAGYTPDGMDMKMRADAWAGLVRREVARMYLAAVAQSKDTP
jgi:hypothetical protein